VTKNTLLEQFVCSDNGISVIDLSQNINLSLLHAYRNQLTTINLVNNTLLKSLIVFNNLLTSLDVTHNTLLEQFNCSFNQITTIDVTQNPALYTLELRNNLLTSVDIRSGNNTRITYYNTRNNPNLKCIFVDDATYSIATWTSIDPSSTFVETEVDCDSLSCSITVDILPDITADNSYTLPSLINGNYYTLTGGNGTQLFSGDVITTSQTIYIYNVDPTDASCFTESSFSITINTIDITDPTDPVDCIIPDFFTPNNDSINDYWSVNCLISTITSINIFNRYGKLIYTLIPGGNGWNGAYQNRLMISNTYWYHINFDDGSKKRGFFSLKR
jgi:gliding motility-associated-like protein